MSFDEHVRLVVMGKLSSGHHEGGLNLVACDVSQYEVECGMLNCIPICDGVALDIGNRNIVYDKNSSTSYSYMEIELLWDMLSSVKGTFNIMLHVVCNTMS